MRAARFRVGRQRTSHLRGFQPKLTRGVAVTIHGFPQKIGDQETCRVLHAIEKKLRRLSKNPRTRPNGEFFRRSLQKILAGVPVPRKFPVVSRSHKTGSLWDWLNAMWSREGTRPSLGADNRQLFGASENDLGCVYRVVTDKAWASSSAAERKKWILARNFILYIYETTSGSVSRGLKPPPVAIQSDLPLAPIMCGLCWRPMAQAHASKCCKHHTVSDKTAPRKRSANNRASRQAAIRNLAKTEWGRLLFYAAQADPTIIGTPGKTSRILWQWRVATEGACSMGMSWVDSDFRDDRKRLFVLSLKMSTGQCAWRDWATQIYFYICQARSQLRGPRNFYRLRPSETHTDFWDWLRKVCVALEDPDAFNSLQYCPEDLLFMVERYFVYRFLAEYKSDSWRPKKRGRQVGAVTSAVPALINEMFEKINKRQCCSDEWIDWAKSNIAMLADQLAQRFRVTKKTAGKYLRRYIRKSIPRSIPREDSEDVIPF